MNVDEIKAGEFIRTRKGIKKVCYINKNKTINKYSCKGRNDLEYDEFEIIKTTEIFKCRSNIIDLIEVGDIVEYILHTALEDLHCIAIVEDEHFLKALKTNKDFKLLSVTTKEQFENIKYKVGD